MKKKDSYEWNYKGNEYMQIYPSIAYYGEGEIYQGGQPIAPGYYVAVRGENTYYITPLAEWLSK